MRRQKKIAHTSTWAARSLTWWRTPSGAGHICWARGTALAPSGRNPPGWTWPASCSTAPAAPWAGNRRGRASSAGARTPAWHRWCSSRNRWSSSRSSTVLSIHSGSSPQSRTRTSSWTVRGASLSGPWYRRMRVTTVPRENCSSWRTILATDSLEIRWQPLDG